MPLISIHASRGGSDIYLKMLLYENGISIHASRGGSDHTIYDIDIDGSGISIHASRGGSDLSATITISAANDFNPRFPRGKRRLISQRKITIQYFNPRFPRGKRPASAKLETRLLNISIHASRGGSDCFPFVPLFRIYISIHASRGGSDPTETLPLVRQLIFQSTLPAGEATMVDSLFTFEIYYFNPRFPRGKRPDEAHRMNLEWNISIHASRGGSDNGFLKIIFLKMIFQSTLPAGEATSMTRSPGSNRQFQSTLPAGEATSGAGGNASGRKDFNPRFPRGKRLDQELAA